MLQQSPANRRRQATQPVVQLHSPLAIKIPATPVKKVPQGDSPRPNNVSQSKAEQVKILEPCGQETAAVSRGRQLLAHCLGLLPACLLQNRSVGYHPLHQESARSVIPLQTPISPIRHSLGDGACNDRSYCCPNIAPHYYTQRYSNTLRSILLTSPHLYPALRPVKNCSRGGGGVAYTRRRR